MNLRRCRSLTPILGGTALLSLSLLIHFLAPQSPVGVYPVETYDSKPAIEDLLESQDPCDRIVYEVTLRGLAKQAAEREKEEEIRKRLSTLDPIPASATVEVTVDELLTAYEENEGTASERFGNKIIKMSGVVDRIEVKDSLDIYFITIASTEKAQIQVVRCIFDRKHAKTLTKLRAGQTVTVQGKYTGSIVDLRMGSCFLVD